jgi:hypothetical protein
VDRTHRYDSSFRNVLVKQSGLANPNRLFHAILIHRINVVAQHRAVCDRDKSDARLCITIVLDIQNPINRIVGQFVNPALPTGWDRPNDGSAWLSCIGLDNVAVTVSSPYMAEIVRHHSIWPSTVAQFFGLAGARSAPRVVPASDEPEEGVRGGIH